MHYFYTVYIMMHFEQTCQKKIFKKCRNSNRTPRCEREYMRAAQMTALCKWHFYLEIPARSPARRPFTLPASGSLLLFSHVIIGDHFFCIHYLGTNISTVKRWFQVDRTKQHPIYLTLPFWPGYFLELFRIRFILDFFFFFFTPWIVVLTIVGWVR